MKIFAGLVYALTFCLMAAFGSFCAVGYVYTFLDFGGEKVTTLPLTPLNLVYAAIVGCVVGWFITEPFMRGLAGLMTGMTFWGFMFSDPSGACHDCGAE